MRSHKSRERVGICLAGFIYIITVLGFISLVQEAAAQGDWSLEARLVNYESLCDLRATALSPPGYVTLNVIDIVVASCQELETELQQPLALVVKIRNLTNSSRVLTAPLPFDVMVYDGAFPRAALAIHWIANLWIKGSGTTETPIATNGAVEFLYLIPRFSGKAEIEFGDIGSFGISTDIGAVKGVDTIEIKKALQAGLVSLTFIGKEEGEKLELTVKKMVFIPLIIVINSGTTTFELKETEHSISVDKEIQLDLSKETEDSVVLRQVGGGRIIRGSVSVEYAFNEKTALVFREMQYSQDELIEQMIAALSDEEYWRRRGAAAALGEIGDRRAIQPLEVVYENDPDARVREAAKVALEKIRLNDAPRWDVNGDGIIDIADLMLVGSSALGTSVDETPLDVNSDGKVDILDLIIVAMHYGETSN